MTTEMTAEQILNREFLPVRAKILEIAATLDRLQRASGDPSSHQQLKSLHEAIDILQEFEVGRAERVQLLFSLPYDQDWRDNFNLA